MHFKFNTYLRVLQYCIPTFFCNDEIYRKFEDVKTLPSVADPDQKLRGWGGGAMKNLPFCCFGGVVCKKCTTF